MAIDFLAVTHTPLEDISIGAPDRAIIGIIGLAGSGKAAILRLAAGVESPSAGVIQAPRERRLIRLGDPLDFSPVGLLALDGALACQDPLVRERACINLERLRRAGATILFASHDQALLGRVADEIWWLDRGRLAAKGDARAVFPKFNAFVIDRLVAWGASQPQPVDLSSRRGDGRAEIVLLEIIGADGNASMVLRSHEPAAVRVVVRFRDAVPNPVIGIMIRTRVGFEVYGTNTELERVQIGPCEAGDTVPLDFRFACSLCPGEYTLTAASHDPDGTPHDWLDDAVAFSVAAERYTAGVADLRATVVVER